MSTKTKQSLPGEPITVNPKTLKSIRTVLGNLRKEKNISQTLMAKKMNKAQSFISNIENVNAVKIPSLPTIVNYLDKIGYAVIITKKTT